MSVLIYIDPIAPTPPDEADVRLGVSYADGALMGSLDLPATSKVRAGVIYDNNTQIGTYEVTLGRPAALSNVIIAPYPSALTGVRHG